MIVSEFVAQLEAFRGANVVFVCPDGERFLPCMVDLSVSDLVEINLCEPDEKHISPSEVLHELTDVERSIVDPLPITAWGVWSSRYDIASVEVSGEDLLVNLVG